MKYEQGSEKVNMGAQNTVVSKPLPMTQDPQVQRTRRVLLIILGVCLALSLAGLVTSIFGYRSQTDGTNWTHLGARLGQSIISIAFYSFGIIVAYRYSQIGLRVFAWLGIISLIGRGIVILVLLTPVIVGITAKSATNDGFDTAVMIGASIAFFILAIVIIVAFILTIIIVKFAFKLARLIEAKQTAAMQQI